MSENLPDKIRLPWKRQIDWANKCHTKLLPDKVWWRLLQY